MDDGALKATTACLRAEGISCLPGIRLADYTTFRLGGPCPLLIQCSQPQGLVAAIRCLARHGLPFHVIGAGSNLLVADAGVTCPVIRYVSDSLDAVQTSGGLTVSGAGSFDALAAYACERGMADLVNASGIPGTVGGAVYGNAGAFGWQIGDDLVAALLVDREGRMRNVAGADIPFAYRSSALADTGDLVLTATLRVRLSEPESLAAERARILALRAERHPDIRGVACAGSFFRNVEPGSAVARRQAAGWFLEQAGAKAMRVGGARVFVKHANIIVCDDTGGAASDVLSLAARMATAVYDRFGIRLQREVQLLGDFPSTIP